MPTYEVTNQPPPLVGYDASDDPALLAALAAFRPVSTAVPDGTAGTEPADERLTQIGRLAGREHAQEQGTATRLSAAGGRAYGTLPRGIRVRDIIPRAIPEI
jgi:hypothetical protein